MRPELIGPDGEPLRQKLTKRRQNDLRMVKQTPHGDMLFHLRVDAPEGVSSDEFNKYVLDYFAMGKDAFERKIRGR